MARPSNRQKLINGEYDPLDSIVCGIPVSLTSQLRELSLSRGVTMQSLIRESVKDWLAREPVQP